MPKAKKTKSSNIRRDEEGHPIEVNIRQVVLNYGPLTDAERKEILTHIGKCDLCLSEYNFVMWTKSLKDQDLVIFKENRRDHLLKPKRRKKKC